MRCSFLRVGELRHFKRVCRQGLPAARALTPDTTDLKHACWMASYKWAAHAQVSIQASFRSAGYGQWSVTRPALLLLQARPPATHHGPAWSEFTS